MHTVTAETLLDEAAWAQRLAHHLLRDDAAAKDLLQDTWVVALRAPPGADGPVRPWLRRVLGNLARNRARDEGRLGARHQAAADLHQPGSGRHALNPDAELVFGDFELRAGSEPGSRGGDSSPSFDLSSSRPATR